MNDGLAPKTREGWPNAPAIFQYPVVVQLTNPVYGRPSFSAAARVATCVVSTPSIEAISLAMVGVQLLLAHHARTITVPVLRNYTAARPPSTGRIAPWTKLAPSEAR
jgi:hypothetical protein